MKTHAKESVPTCRVVQFVLSYEKEISEICIGCVSGIVSYFDHAGFNSLNELERLFPQMNS